VQEWLFSIGLSEQTPIFLKEQVNGQRLIQLELNDFEGLGLSEDTIDRLRDAFKDLPIRRESVRPSVSRLDFSSVSDNDKRSSWTEGTVSQIDMVLSLPNKWATNEVPAHPTFLPGFFPLTPTLFPSPQSMTKVMTAPSDPVEQWDCYAVRNWLLSEGFDDTVCQCFVDEDVDGPQLLLLSDDNLRHLGISHASERQRCLMAIRNLPTQLVAEGAALPPRSVLRWEPEHVASFMHEAGYGHHAAAFQRNYINGRALLAMQPRDLMDLGMTDPDEQQAFLADVEERERLGSELSSAPEMPLASEALFWTTADVVAYCQAHGAPSSAVNPLVAVEMDGRAFVAANDGTFRRAGVRDPLDRNALLRLVDKVNRAQEPYTDAGLRSPGFSFGSATMPGMQHGRGVNAGVGVESDLRAAYVRDQGVDTGTGTGTGTDAHVPDSDSPAYVVVPERAVIHWHVRDVRDWLRHNELGHHAAAFASANIDGERLLRLSDNDFFRLGVTQADDLNRITAAQRSLCRRHQEEVARRAADQAAFADDVASRVYNRLGQQEQQEHADPQGLLARPAGQRGPLPPTEWEELEVTLIKGDAGFGFTLQGGEGADVACNPTVSSVRQGGPADGKLAAGDELLAINNRGHLDEGALSETIMLVQRSGDSLHLRLRRPRDGASPGSSAASAAATHATARLRPVDQTGGQSVGAGAAAGAPLVAARRQDSGVTLASKGRTSSFSNVEDLTALLHASDAALRLQSSTLAHQDATRARTNSLIRSNRASTSFPSADAGAAEGLANRDGLSAAAAAAAAAAANAWVRVDENNPLTWTHAKTCAFFTVAEVHEVARAAKKRKLVGAQLATMAPADVRTLDPSLATVASAEELDRAEAAVAALQAEYPAPLMAHWSVADVGEWLDHRGFQQRRNFARHKIDGPALATMHQAQLDALGVPGNVRHPLMQRVTELRQTFVPNTAAAIEWSPPEVRDWLMREDMAASAAVLHRKRLTGAELIRLQHEDLYRMGIRDTREQSRLLSAIAKLSAVNGNPSLVLTPATPRGSMPANTAGSAFASPLFRTRSASPSVSAGPSTPESRARSPLVSIGDDVANSSFGGPFRDSPLRQSRTVDVSAAAAHIPGSDSPSLLSQGNGSMLSAAGAQRSERVELWSASQVCDWLAYVGMGQYCATFAERGVDGAALLRLDAGRLETEFGLAPDEAREVVEAVDVLVALVPAETSQHGTYTGLWRWSESQVELWLISEGLGRHTAAFRDHAVDGTALAAMTDARLRDELCVEAAAERATILRSVDAVTRVTAQPLLHNVASWNPEQVNLWLARQGLRKHSTAFEREGIDGEAMLRLRAVDLHRIGVINDAEQQTLLAATDRLKAAAAHSRMSNAAPASEWTAEDVSEWLRGQGCDEEAEVFRSYGIGGGLLLSLEGRDLDRLGTPAESPAHSALLAAIASLRRVRRSSLPYGNPQPSSLLRPQLSAAGMAEAAAGLGSGSAAASGDAALRNEEALARVSDWSLTDVGEWLASEGFARFRATFQSHSITGPALLRLSPGDLDRMHIVDLQDRAGLLSAVARLRGGLPSPLMAAGGNHGAAAAEDRQPSSISSERIAALLGNGSYLHTALLRSHATHALRGQPAGAFVVHQADGVGLATLSYVRSDGTPISLPLLLSGPNERLRLRVAGCAPSASFATLQELVDHYAASGHTDGAVSLALRPELAASVLQSAASRQSSRGPGSPASALALPDWDKRRMLLFDAKALLQTRAAGSFYVISPSPGETVLTLTVDDAGAVREYPIVAAVSGSDGMETFRLAASPESEAHDSLPSLVAHHMRERGPLPTLLRERNVSGDIRLNLQRKQLQGETPWSWWQLGAASPAEAEAVLEDKATGAFVIYEKPRLQGQAGFVLAYKVQSAVHREDIFYTPASVMFTAGVHLAKAQHKVAADLHALVDLYCQPSPELLCALRVSEQPDPATHKTPRPPANRSSVMLTAPRAPPSWLQVHAQDVSPGVLEGRSTGAFYVARASAAPGAYTLVYKHAGEEHRELINAVTAAGGKFHGFSLEIDPGNVFPTLQDLLLFHENNRQKLKCTLNIASVCWVVVGWREGSLGFMTRFPSRFARPIFFFSSDVRSAVQNRCRCCHAKLPPGSRPRAIGTGVRSVTQ
jgi:hypothetical protein